MRWILVSQVNATSPPTLDYYGDEEEWGDNVWNTGGGQTTPLYQSQFGGAVKTAPAPAVKPLDPVVKRALERATTGYHVGMPEGGIERLTSPVSIILMGDGVFEVRKYQIGHSVAQLSKEKVPGLEVGALTEGFFGTVPKIPYSILTEMVSFFRHVNVKHKSEAYVEVFYDPDTGLYETHVPLQDISAGRVEHAGEHDVDGRLIHVLGCHSHHTMDGYFSSTDDNDEQRFNGRMFGVIGKITQPIPMMLWRVRVAGKFIPLSITDIFDTEEQEAQVVHISLGAMLKGTEKDGRMAFSIVSPDVFAESVFPDSWLELLITSRGDDRWKQIPGHQTHIDTAQLGDYKTPHGRWWDVGSWSGMGGGGRDGGKKTGGNGKASFYKGSYFVVKQGTGELYQLLDNNQLAKVKLQGMTVQPAEHKVDYKN